MPTSNLTVPKVRRVGVGPLGDDYKILTVFESDADLQAAKLVYRIDDGSLQSLTREVDPIPPYYQAVFTIEEPGPDRMISYAAAAAETEEDLLDDESVFDMQPHQFKTFGESGPEDVGLVTCNGLEEAKNGRPTFLWEDLLDSAVGTNPEAMDLLVLAGDQVYADPEYLDLERLGHTQADYENEAIPDEDLLEIFRRRYVEVWGKKAILNVLSCVPSIAMWDDHDIYNGYGSQDTENESAYRAAEQTFFEFQGSVNPDPSIGFQAESSKAFSLVTENAGFVVTDGRTNRNHETGTILGDEQIEELEQELTDLTDPDHETPVPEHLFVVVGIPFLFVRKFIGEVADEFDRLDESNFESDIRDGWRWEENLGEYERLMELLFEYQHETDRPKLTVLSGDIHLASKGYLEREMDGSTVRIPQVTSSAIAYHPTSSLRENFLSQVMDEEYEMETGVTGSFQRLATNNNYYPNTRALARRNYCLLKTSRSHDEDLAFVYRFEADRYPEDDSQNLRGWGDDDSRPRTVVGDRTDIGEDVRRYEEKNIGRLEEGL